jgi:hypothetical protein
LETAGLPIGAAGGIQCSFDRLWFQLYKVRHPA